MFKILADFVPGKGAAVHGYVHARGQDTGGHESAAQVEEGVRAAKLEGYHGAGQHDGLVQLGRAEVAGSFGHAVGAVGYDDPGFRGLAADFQNAGAVIIGHFKAVYQLYDLKFNRGGDAYLLENFRQVGVLEGKDALEFIVMLVKGAAGNHQPDWFVIHHATPLQEARVGLFEHVNGVLHFLCRAAPGNEQGVGCIDDNQVCHINQYDAFAGTDYQVAPGIDVHGLG